jgi:hypothetical protein
MSFPYNTLEWICFVARSDLQVMASRFAPSEIFAGIQRPGRS